MRDYRIIVKYMNYNDELTDNQLKKLDDYYFERYAKNNEDFAGCDIWRDNLEEDEIYKILNNLK